MLKLGIASEGRRRTAVLGLTDVNLKRLQDGLPIKVSLSDFIENAGQVPSSRVDVVVFHATRASVLEFAELAGIDAKVALDALGEG